MSLMTDSASTTLALAVLQSYYPYTGGGSDTRTLAVLVKQFTNQHLGQLIRDYQRKQAEQALDDADLKTVVV